MRPRSWRGWHTELSGTAAAAGELDVVVADDGEVARDVDTHAGHLLEQSEGEEVVGTESGGGPPGAGQAGNAFSRPPALGDVERGRLEDEQAAAGGPGERHGWRAPCRRSTTWTVVIGPPTKAMRSCPCSRRWVTAQPPPSTSSTPTLHQARARGTVDQHHRQTLAQEHLEAAVS